MSPSATTRLAAVIGRPVRHSLSPAIHNAAFAAAGLDWAYLAFEPTDGAAAVAAARALGLAGLSVTMPFKQEVARAVDELSPAAASLGAVNCVQLADGRTIGHNTDGGGLLDALAAQQRWTPDGRRCVVLGAGGAGRAVVRALAEAGAASVVVVNRSEAHGREAAALAGRLGSVDGPAAVTGADLVVNATPVGMGSPTPGADPGAGATPIATSLLREGQLVVDLIYEPAETALLRAARQTGAVAVNGLGMLVHQAARSFTLWTGQAAPLEAMGAAVAAALERRAARR